MFNGSLMTIKSNTYSDFDITGRKIISAGSYKVIKSVQDVGSYRDADGVLHRNALDHAPVKIMLKTQDLISNDAVRGFFGEIQKRFIEPKERKLLIRYYVPELDDYEEAEMYMPDPAFLIDHIEGTKIIYKELELHFIGY